MVSSTCRTHLFFQLCALVWITSHAAAEPLPTAALVASNTRAPELAGLDTAIQEGLERLGVVRIVLQVGLDLEAVQLAIDCLESSARCLGSAAAVSGVQVLVVPRLEHHDTYDMLRLTRYDARDPNTLRDVVRGHSDPRLLLAEVPDMLHALFWDFASASAQPEPQPELAAPQPLQPIAAVSSGPAVLGPVLLGSVGVLALAAGVIAGKRMLDAEDDYARGTLRSSADADRVLAARSRGRTQATVANVLYGAGGAVTLAAAIWLTLELTTGRERATQLQAAVGAGQVGVLLVHRGAGL